MGEYEVVWDKGARLKLAQMKDYLTTSPQEIFKKSKLILSNHPQNKGVKVTFSGYEFEDYYWVNINNVIIVYDVVEPNNQVLVDACFFTNTGFSLRTFFGEYDPFDE